MTANISKIGYIDYRIEYYDDNRKHLDFWGETISGFENNPLQVAINIAKYRGCESVTIDLK